ncbi:MAG: hypothetical protein ABIQ18_20560 [Umezawaea sp.]
MPATVPKPVAGLFDVDGCRQLALSTELLILAAAALVGHGGFGMVDLLPTSRSSPL